jgi:hypothetical protein
MSSAISTVAFALTGKSPGIGKSALGVFKKKPQLIAVFDRDCDGPFVLAHQLMPK